MIPDRAWFLKVNGSLASRCGSSEGSGLLFFLVLFATGLAHMRETTEGARTFSWANLGGGLSCREKTTKSWDVPQRAKSPGRSIAL